ncbi:MAG: flippase-like domain-containing protein [Gemmatimonadota bacterium]|nr:flippase-like domain-containing protein [Gemmatimonadota bacterium]
MPASSLTLRRTLAVTAKAAVSVALLVWLFRRVGWDAVRDELATADLRMLAIYVVVSFTSIVVSAVKWRSLAAALGMREPAGRMTVLYLVGLFFNNILPTSVGGDVVRAWELGRRHERLADATASVFMERFTGFTVLLAWTLVAAAVWPAFVADPRILIGGAVAIGAYLALTWAVFHRPALEALRARLKLPMIAGLLRRAASLQDAIHRYRGRPRAIWEGFGWSAVFYLLTVGTTLAGCLTVGARPAVGDLFVAVPVMLVLFSVPISIGGIGLQEWAFFTVLTRIGVPAPAALSLGLIFRVRTIVFGLIGGALYPLSGIRGPAPAAPVVPAGDGPRVRTT